MKNTEYIPVLGGKEIQWMNPTTGEVVDKIKKNATNVHTMELYKTTLNRKGKYYILEIRKEGPNTLLINVGERSLGNERKLDNSHKFKVGLKEGWRKNSIYELGEVRDVIEGMHINWIVKTDTKNRGPKYSNKKGENITSFGYFSAYLELGFQSNEFIFEIKKALLQFIQDPEGRVLS